MWHKKRVAGVIVSLALIMVLLFPMQAQAVEGPGKARFYGELFVNGVRPATPKVVSAWIGGVKYAEVTSGSITGQQIWEYLIDVPADVESTVPIEGGRTGDIVVFKIAGVNATPTGQFIWDNFMLINLSAVQPTRLEGDVNNDGFINSADALLVAKHIVGTTTLTGDNFLAADVNDDNVVNSADLLLIKKFIVGTITQFPGGTYIP